MSVNFSENDQRTLVSDVHILASGPPEQKHGVHAHQFLAELRLFLKTSLSLVSTMQSYQSHLFLLLKSNLFILKI